MEYVFKVVSQIRDPIALVALIVAGLIFGIWKSKGGKSSQKTITYIFVLGLVVISFSLGLPSIIQAWKALSSPSAPVDPQGTATPANIISGPAEESPSTSLASKRIRLNVREKPLPEVFSAIAKEIGADAAVGPGLDGKKLSLVMDGPASAILDEICQLKKCTWEILPKGSTPMLFVNPVDNPPQQ